MLVSAFAEGPYGFGFSCDHYMEFYPTGAKRCLAVSGLPFAGWECLSTIVTLLVAIAAVAAPYRRLTKCVANLTYRLHRSNLLEKLRK